MRIFLSLCVLAIGMPAHAWSAFGHRLVGELAERQLSETARLQIADLLQDEANPTLAGIATWADEVREQPAYKFSASFHYVNIRDADCVYAAARDCADGKCVVGAIGRYMRELGDTSLPRRQRAQALKFVVHFIGDAHQPLHAGNRSDRGGNDFQINLEGRGTNLHSVWDRSILEGAKLDLPRYAERLDAQRRDATTLAGGTAQDWAMESCSLLAARSIYPSKPGTLDPAYPDAMRPLVEERIVLASRRLAQVLERSLGAGAGH